MNPPVVARAVLTVSARVITDLAGRSACPRPGGLRSDVPAGSVLAEIGPADPVVVQEIGAGARHRDRADLEDVALVGERQRGEGILLDEQDGSCP